ncbi:hypothetical protein [Phaeodactylibacter xiamenensis]|uniref:hypothetical protein n=1 Tax=Phaeodactylibacter xiamenensis TaxID=1524460 RepID=UPI0024A8D24A|nr:hypothetical protein [Phaeodactylibacter xiamenensis]
MRLITCLPSAALLLFFALANIQSVASATGYKEGNPCDTIIMNTGGQVLASKIQRGFGRLRVTDCRDASKTYTIETAILAEVRYASGKHIDFKSRRVRKASRSKPVGLYRLLGITLLVLGLLIAPLAPSSAYFLFYLVFMSGVPFLIFLIGLFVSAFVLVLPVLLIMWSKMLLLKAKREQTG